jgi:hypothetical protein
VVGRELGRRFFEWIASGKEALLSLRLDGPGPEETTMATAKKQTATKKKPAAKSDTDLRVLAWRIQPAQFDAMTAACKRLGLTKTALLNEGIALALAKRGEKTAAAKFEVAS